MQEAFAAMLALEKELQSGSAGLQPSAQKTAAYTPPAASPALQSVHSTPAAPQPQAGHKAQVLSNGSLQRHPQHPWLQSAPQPPLLGPPPPPPLQATSRVSAEQPASSAQPAGDQTQSPAETDEPAPPGEADENPGNSLPVVKPEVEEAAMELSCSLPQQGETGAFCTMFAADSPLLQRPSS